MLPLMKLDELRERLKVPLPATGRSGIAAPPWFSKALPDGAFPSGITELTAPRALGGGTLIATQAIALAQRDPPDVTCAWIDPEATLHAPGLMQHGVDLTRLLIVRPPRDKLRAIAVRIARSGAVALLAIDFHPVGANGVPAPRSVADERWVRRLQLACEEGGTVTLLLTDNRAKQSAPLPVALKLLLMHTSPRRLEVTVLKERSGRTGMHSEVELP